MKALIIIIILDINIDHYNYSNERMKIIKSFIYECLTFVSSISSGGLTVMRNRIECPESTKCCCGVQLTEEVRASSGVCGAFLTRAPPTFVARRISMDGGPAETR